MFILLLMYYFCLVVTDASDLLKAAGLKKKIRNPFPKKIGFFWFLKKKKNVMFGIMKKPKDGREIFQ